MNFSEGLSLYGDFFLQVFDHHEDGSKSLRFRYARKNQITNDGRLVLLQLLSQVAGGSAVQAQPELGQIWSLSIGDGVIPPHAAQTSLISPVWTGQLIVASGERSYVPGLFQVLVHKEVSVGDATGETFAEAALFTRGDQDVPDPTYPTWEVIPNRVMYSRQIFPSFVKGATMSVVFDWTLGITVA